jgi:nickel transport protein
MSTHRTLRGLVAAACMAATVTVAAAHQLIVFAWVDGDTVMVESKFAGGGPAVAGTVSVYDGGDNLLYTLEVSDKGTAEFPLDEAGIKTGLRIEMDSGDGHEDYWILTPEDIADQRSGM